MSLSMLGVRTKLYGLSVFFGVDAADMPDEPEPPELVDE